LGFRRNETDDDESFVGILRDDNEIFEGLTFFERETEVFDGERAVASESRERNESFDAGRNEREDDVGVVESRDSTGENGSNIDTIDLGRGVLHFRVLGGRVVDLTDRRDDARVGSVDVDETDRDDLADREQSCEIGRETLTSDAKHDVR
jgi:hypothetical protein